ncbi:hypothetical protein Bpfe_030439 [Biomphalaria pfeifferi]|uniref:Uncharacterized protein n=1 Tax=Biomphalaria pfeifferi TaxID=112525 RepID=A0AAD8ARA0_BIOPF|nr:hypothetical protein Bpfe_030439 [Biomphalaria pfeifferi]
MASQHQLKEIEDDEPMRPMIDESLDLSHTYGDNECQDQELASNLTRTETRKLFAEQYKLYRRRRDIHLYTS